MRKEKGQHKGDTVGSWPAVEGWRGGMRKWATIESLLQSRLATVRCFVDRNVIIMRMRIGLIEYRKAMRS